MEKSKQIQIGLLALLALLLIANLFGGGFQNWFGQSEGDQIRQSAASMTGSNTVAPTQDLVPTQGTGNIPGTNVNATQAPTGPVTAIKYEDATYDFGVADEGTVVKHIYKFTNTGDEPLIISNARGSCGCTVPTWPKQPIPPGGKGEINVEFNTKGKPGRQSKQVTVTANTNPSDTHLEIHGEVRGKEQPVSKGH
ncbi:MAG: DUF1573 domain-containing protein [Saprospiraceae bacterium]|nr:DUF1573 domain-containing protein [Saprospiraceae bacterium]